MYGNEIENVISRVSLATLHEAANALLSDHDYLFSQPQQCSLRPDRFDVEIRKGYFLRFRVFWLKDRESERFSFSWTLR